MSFGMLDSKVFGKHKILRIPDLGSMVPDLDMERVNEIMDSSTVVSGKMTRSMDSVLLSGRTGRDMVRRDLAKS